MKQTKIIPFDLSLATDDNVYTRDGRKARIICTDCNAKDNEIVALIYIADTESPYTYDKNGKYFAPTENPLDLFIRQEIEINLHFKPFQKVLVRNNEKELWRPDFFSHKSPIIIDEDTNTAEIRYFTIGSTRRSNRYCIPYDDFKHLCNTADNPTF